MITCIIILYNPNLSQLQKTIESISFQVNKVLLVDNGKNFISFLSSYNNVEYIQLGDNYGIAYAQNVGIKKAREFNSEYILFSDQDTTFPSDYVINMFKIYHELEQNGIKIASLAPSFLNANDIVRSQPFICLENNKIKLKCYDSGTHKVAHSISSGQIVKTSFFNLVGDFNETLFIDYVDFEWCWRAESKGFENFQTADVIINHKIGDNSKNFINRKVIIRSPLRFYYMIRNAEFICKYIPISKIQKKYLTLLKLKGIVDFLMVSNNKVEVFNIVRKAIFDARKKQMGKYSKTL